MKLTESIKTVLANGCTIEYRRKHLYKSSKGDYCILFFDKHGDVKSSIPEERFRDLEDATNRFMEFFSES
jgi:ferredoxin-thioredoxin reductase catalytic subunit